MKKCQERASLTRAFVNYARLVGDREDASPLDIYKYMIGACGRNTDLAIDLWAAHETLLVLELLNENDVLSALMEVYVRPFIKSPRRIPRKNEISMRILRFAYDNHVDERSVYRRLLRARRLWIDIRARATNKK